MKIKSIVFALVIFLVLPAAGFSKSNVGPRMKDYFKNAFLPHLWDDAKNTFTNPDDLIMLGIGGALAAAAHQYDRQMNDYWKDHELDYGMADFGNDFWGRGELQGGIALSMMLIGWSAGNDRIADAGEVLLEAQLIQGALINIIKPVAHKQRPNGGDYLSFPSGHTGTAFCTAAVLQHRFGWKLGLPAYAAAVVTAMARMDVQAHWLSDAVMGAAIATVTGYAVSAAHDDYPYDVTWKKTKMTVAPLAGPEGYGVAVMARW